MAAGVAAMLPVPAWAQTADVRDLEVSSPGLGLEHIGFSELVRRVPSLATTFQTTLTNNYLVGTLVYGDYTARAQANGPTQYSFTVTAPCLSNGPASAESAAGRVLRPDRADTDFADPYGIRFAGATPQAAFDGYTAFLTGAGTGSYTGSQSFSAARYREDIYGCSVGSSPNNPVVGNPNSLQFSMVRAGLDFDMQAEAVPARQGDVGSAALTDAGWLIGGRASRVSRPGDIGTTFEVRGVRSWRVFEGGRGRLSVDVPVSYQDFGDGRQLRASAAVALEMPVTATWTVEPRVAYGFVDDNAYGIGARVASGTIASRLRLQPFGLRGLLTVGNMIGYSRVTRVEIEGQKTKAGTDNIVLRNGAGYEEPLPWRVFGRGVSVRTSYTMTNVLGDDVYTKTVHAISSSFGVRARGTSMRIGSELFRLGILAELGRGYRASSLFIGYRF